MHPLTLRFPNSGIRAKGRSPIVRSRPRSPARGRPAAARASPQGRPTSLTGVVARRGCACGHGRLRPTRRGDSRPQAHPLVVRHP
ncbi:hypothetical protein GW17_00050588 [Ensete ventricosum]|nr:hypothetical protein GW17_00050588 [Ensete ventricosum]